MLTIKNLKVKTDGKEILNNISLNINNKEIHAVMGKNGIGKSTLANTLMGDPRYEILNGSIYFNNEDLIKMTVDERARKGMFLAMQYPNELDGISNLDFIKNAINSRNKEKINTIELYKLIENTKDKLNLKDDYIKRDVNVGFSGGEKKKNEIAQILMFKPKLIILDEIDSGLDVDAVKTVGKTLKEYYENNDEISFLIITHHTNILKYLKPTHVHVIDNGRITQSGDNSLAEKIEKEGYKS
ncbi:MAG: Fe-S cluster assembly ATPase SufC [Tenericutes bacterium]|nr:Fe-S cluster assembly ATPase SufC [Bacilli bacterium]MDD3995586.1 Fe-S cluster assembly ATPase SufC [Bacilli bacterium]MDD4624320.1 Fe-S cluster assembly ATPase SufC [Bacilli bacterium]NLV90026.1 Fe-S cluster assembly ATPase SufC [Mycoplasmatota bacterium]